MEALKTSSLVVTTGVKLVLELLKNPHFQITFTIWPDLQLTRKEKAPFARCCFCLTWFRVSMGKDLYPGYCWKQSDVVSQLSKAVIPVVANKSKTILRKKKNLRTFSSQFQNYKAVVIKALLYWQKSRHLWISWLELRIQKKILIYSPFIFNRGAKAVHWGKSLFSNDTGTTGLISIHVQKDDLRPLLHTIHTEINLKLITDLNIRTKTINLLEKK